MPLQNRVTPLGELVADPARGLVYGNRGCLHDETGRIRRRYNGKRWIACRLEFRGWQRGPLLQPGRFTELFFLDEATAFAAGHRPCALCRYEDYARFVEIWRGLHPGQVGADAIDAQLHGERVAPETRAQLHHEAALDELPDGAFVLQRVHPISCSARSCCAGRRPATTRRDTPRGRTAGPTSGHRLITPPSLVAVLRTGWEPARAALPPLGARGRDLTSVERRRSGRRGLGVGGDEAEQPPALGGQRGGGALRQAPDVVDHQRGAARRRGRDRAASRPRPRPSWSTAP